MGTILYWVGGVVAAYLLFAAIMGIFKGRGSVTRIWFWTKKLFWVLFVIAGLIFIAKALRGKTKEKEAIEKKIAEVNAIENKTAVDLQQLKKLEEEKKDKEKEIVNITKKYQNKVDAIKSKPDTPKPGDAGRSSDNLTNSW